MLKWFLELVFNVLKDIILLKGIILLIALNVEIHNVNIVILLVMEIIVLNAIRGQDILDMLHQASIIDYNKVFVLNVNQVNLLMNHKIVVCIFVTSVV